MCVHAFLPHDAMEKCSLYRLSHLCIMLKQVNIFKICSPSYSQPQHCDLSIPNIMAIFQQQPPNNILDQYLASSKCYTWSCA